jgi:hypothetical protein
VAKNTTASKMSGARGGAKGGPARAASLSASERKAIAVKGGKAKSAKKA